MNRLTPHRRLAAFTAFALSLMGALSTGSVLAETSPPPPDYSPAEQRLLMSDQLQKIRPPVTLSYHFQRSGTLETPFEDKVSLQLARQADGRCCAATGEFLTGDRRMKLPDVEQAQGNPVTLYFLEHDIREMQRLTKGQANYFRKRIRMALYQGATMSDVSIGYRGKTVAAQEIVIRPYLDDPNRARFEQFTRKQYVFVLSDAVPGSVVSIRTTLSPDGSALPLVEEELRLEGTSPLRPATLSSSTHHP